MGYILGKPIPMIRQKVSLQMQKCLKKKTKYEEEDGRLKI
jgi:hypothetical protein